MVMIADIDGYSNNILEGIFNVHHISRGYSRNDCVYTSMELEDVSGRLQAYAWPSNYRGVEINRGINAISARFRTKKVHGKLVANIINAKPIAQEFLPLQLLPYPCPQPKLLVRLTKLANEITTPAIYDFIEDVFNDNNIGPRFMVIPASRHHHHCYPGGHLEHSVECAELIARIIPHNSIMRDLTITAALLHDIGKVCNYSANSTRYQRSIVAHETRTLMILASHLRTLDRRWQEALEYLLTWKPGKGSSKAKIPVAILVRMVDNFSAAASAQEIAFDSLPDSYQWAKIADYEWYWRLIH